MPQLPSRFVDKILCGDAYQVLQKFPDESIDCVVSSPPYWAMRNYGIKGQMGLEPNFQDYIDKLCHVFDGVKRVLKKKGTCWVNLGDTYFGDAPIRKTSCAKLNQKDKVAPVAIRRSAELQEGVQRKSLVQIPARFALEMTRRGWILRNEIIWHKPSCMPSSVKDRFTVDFEKLFFFVKNIHYYFEQQFEPLKDEKSLIRALFKTHHAKKRQYSDDYVAAVNPKTSVASNLKSLSQGRNKRCVWSIANRPFAGNHYAVYPPQLIEVPIKAGCPEGGIVLDLFMGSGTTALVAKALKRKFVGIELNPAYVRLAKERLRKESHVLSKSLYSPTSTHQSSRQLP